MKRVATVVFSLSVLLGLATGASAQRASSVSFAPNHSVIAPHSSGIVNGRRSEERISPVFLPGLKGNVPLAANVQEELSYFTDTTDGNWVFYDAFFDSTGPIRVRYPDGSLVDTEVTMHYKGIGERFTTSLKTAYLDSVTLTFAPHTLGPQDQILFRIRPLYDVDATQGGTIPLIDYFNSYATSIIKKDVVYQGNDIVVDAFNTITVVMSPHLLLAAKNHNFAVVAQPIGPDIATDSIRWQMDAQLSDVQDPWTVDTDQTRSYSVRYDSALAICGTSPLGDLQQIDMNGDLTGQAYFGNIIMTAHVSGVPSAVAEDPASQYRLAQNYPNPVGAKTDIYYNLATSGHVSLKLYNALGQEVATMVDGMKPAGENAVTLRTDYLDNGMYFYKLQAGEFTDTKSLVVNK